MRKLFAGLMVSALAGSIAQADVLGIKNLAVDGSVEFSGNKASNETDNSKGANDTRGDVQSRVMLGLDGVITDVAKGRVEVYRNSDTAGKNAQFDSSQGEDLNTAQSNIAISNAYLEIPGFLHLDSVRVGRQYVGRPGDPIVFLGPINDDKLSVSFLDALTVSKKVGPVTILGGTGKLSEDDPPRGSAGDTNAGDVSGDMNVSWIIAGADDLVKTDIFSVPLELGYYQRNFENSVTSSDNDTLTVMDLRAGANLMENQVKFGLEYAMNGGQINTGAGLKTDYKGNALFLNGSFAPTNGVWGVHAKYANTSGDKSSTTKKREDFFAINSDYRFGEIASLDNTFNGGTAMTIDSTLSGLSVINVGGMYTLPWDGKKWALKGDVFNIKYNKVAPGTSHAFGTEVDLAATYAYSANIGMKLGYAMLNPGNGLTGGGAAPDDPITKLSANLLVKWGSNN